MTTPTTPRDAIAGLIEKLTPPTGAYGLLMVSSDTLGLAATQLDALQERVKELTGLLATGEDLRRQVKDVAEQWQSRATRAEQERDEAYERTAKVCDAWPEQIHDVMEHDGSPVSATSCAKSLADRIRRLAGPEKEKTSASD